MRILAPFRESRDFKQQHVERLARQVKEYTSIDLETISADYDGWWCKTGCYREKGPILLMDLDTSIIGPIDELLDIVETHDFTSTEDPNRSGQMNGSLVSWKDDISHVYDKFSKRPEIHILSGKREDEVVRELIEHDIVLMQNILPECYLQSYKVHIRRKQIHPNCRIIYFHGLPRPWQSTRGGAIPDDEIRSMLNERSRY